MTDKIEPALTPEEWRDTDRAMRQHVGALPERADDLAQVIALANAALPDSDPRKITREDVRACRRETNDWFEDRDEMLRGLADRIAALLPPEPK